MFKSLQAIYEAECAGLLSPLHEMNRCTLKHRWIILEIHFQNKDNWAEIEIGQKSFRTKLIFILVATSISKTVVSGARKTHTRS